MVLIRFLLVMPFRVKVQMTMNENGGRVVIGSGDDGNYHELLSVAPIIARGEGR